MNQVPYQVGTFCKITLDKKISFYCPFKKGQYCPSICTRHAQQEVWKGRNREQRGTLVQIASKSDKHKNIDMVSARWNICSYCSTEGKLNLFMWFIYCIMVGGKVEISIDNRISEDLSEFQTFIRDGERVYHMFYLFPILNFVFWKSQKWVLPFSLSVANKGKSKLKSSNRFSNLFWNNWWYGKENGSFQYCIVSLDIGRTALLRGMIEALRDFFIL